MASVLLQSKRYDEAAAEYHLLVAIEPDNFSYRLGLARALAWGKQPRAAEQAILELLRRQPNHPEYEGMLLSVRSQVTPSADEAERWVAKYPRSYEYRHMYARALARERRNDAAIAQFDTLIALRSLTTLFLERAYVHYDARNYVAAQRDVDIAVRGMGTPAAYLLLSELHRARGDLVAARAAIAQAGRGRPRDLEVRAASARLAREEHPPAAFMPDVSDPGGWFSSGSTSGDNLGANLTTTGFRRGTRLGGIDGVDASVGFTSRWISERSASPEAGPSAYGPDAAISREGTLGIYYARARARGGFMYHPAGQTVAEGSIAANLFVNAWGAGVELFTGPAYPSLLTLASFLPDGPGSALLVERGATFSVAGPMGRVDVAASLQPVSISDGNQRRTFKLYASAPVSARLNLAYSGTMLSFSQFSELYWAPIRYAAHGVGPELHVSRRRGLSAAVRAFPGGVWATQFDTVTAEIKQSAAFQLSASGDIGYRANDWELLASVGYGNGRAGEYQRIDAGVQLRFRP